MRHEYDGDELVAEYDGVGTILRRYTHGVSADDPVAWFEGSAMTSVAQHMLLADHQGSIIAAADASGTPVGINRYDEWGVPDATNIGKFQYTGQVWLPDLGMYHYKARIYSPTLGRFLQTDPIGYDDQVNLYAYVGNDPVNKTDPSGLYTCETTKACELARQLRRELRAEKFASLGNNRVVRHAAAIMRMMGTEGKEGPKISLGDLGGRDYGSHSKGLITVDINKINRNPGEANSTSVLGHELTHYDQWKSGRFQGRSSEDYWSREGEALSNEAFIDAITYRNSSLHQVGDTGAQTYDRIKSFLGTFYCLGSSMPLHIRTCRAGAAKALGE